MSTASAESTSTTVKLSYEDELRRFTLDKRISFKDLQAKATELFPKLVDCTTYRFFWIDDENDKVSCTSDSEIDEAIRVMSKTKNGYLKFDIVVPEVQKTSPNLESDVIRAYLYHSGKDDSAPRFKLKSSNSINENTNKKDDGIQLQGEKKSEYNLFEWGGSVHVVPERFEFPHHITTKELWDLWFFGNPELGICPYKGITPKSDLQKVKEGTKRHPDSVRYSRAKAVMESIENEAKFLFVLDENLMNMTYDDSNNIFDRAFVSVMEKVDDGKSSNDEKNQNRWYSLSYSRIYSIILNHRQKANPGLIKRKHPGNVDITLTET